MAALAVAVAAVAVVVAVVVAGVATHLAAHVHSLQTTIYWLQHLLCFAQCHMMEPRLHGLPQDFALGVLFRKVVAVQ